MALSNMTITPEFGNSTVIAIDCGTSIPKLSGSIDISAYNNLLSFKCTGHGITGFYGNTFCNNLTSLRLSNNKLTVLPVFSGMPFLKEMRLDNNEFAGSMTSLSALTSLVTVRLQQNRNLTGSLPQLSSLSNLESFFCIDCALSGALPALSSNTLLVDFRCDSQFGTSHFTGSIPNLSYNTNLKYFYGFNNEFSGNIPDLSNNSTLFEFRVRDNLLTGWTGGTVSNTLRFFDASNNLLTQSAINAILAAFVAANRSTGSLILSGGGNPPPSGQGLTDKATLISRAWTVVTS